MSDEEKFITSSPHMGKAHELAKHRDTKKLPILKGVNRIPMQQGIATAICSVVGYFDESRYMRESLMVLDKNKKLICCECMEVLKRLRLSQYETQGQVVDGGDDLTMDEKIVSINERIEEHACTREYIERKK